MSKSKHVISWRRRTKERMVASFHGVCSICREEYPQEVFEFHHLNPAEKEFALGKISSNCMSWDKIVMELRKCVMLCANCHRLLEYGYVELPENSLRFDESYTDYKKRIKNKIAYNKCICGKKKPVNKKYCSHKCYHLNEKRINWPTKDELKLLLKEKSLSKIKKMYGVSESTVRKWKTYYRL